MGHAILQFGTSRFLQAHVDLFVSQALERGEAGQAIGAITVVQTTNSPASAARVAALAAGEGYPVRIRGLRHGRRIDETVTCRAVRQAVQADAAWPALREAMASDVRVIVSNTADRGYQLDDADGPDLLDDPVRVPRSFPAKLLVLLHHRWGTLPAAALSIFPCELIERNGEVLRDVVRAVARQWRLDAGFIDWLGSHCIWANSLVDRIVSEALHPVGAVAEPYALWAIERQPGLVLPCAHEAILVTDDLERHERLKLFLLNAGHTFLAERWLADRRPEGETVQQAMNDPALRRELEAFWADEVLPVFDALGQRAEAQDYLVDLRERLLNPFLDHRLADIAQNHAQKKQRRLAPIVALAAKLNCGLGQPRLRAALADEASTPTLPAPRVVRLHPDDNVVISLDQLVSGVQVAGEGVTVSGLIPPGHKMASRAIEAGEAVRRYGQIIGFASQPIRPGQHVHSHNLAMGEFVRDYAFGADVRETAPAPQPASFDGIVRDDGRVATRNYIGILTSVNCSATVARAIADHFRRDIHPEALAAFAQVDGVVALTHGTGCGIDSEGEGLAILQRTLGGYACHPNFAGVLVIGLGCETNQIPKLLATQGLADSGTLRTFTIQDAGGTSQAIARGIELVREMLPQANRVQRRSVPASHLVIGLQCGGSDGYSGISANPVLGAAVDLLVAHGGAAILSETPEIYGAEHLLTRRAQTVEIGRKLVARIRWWEDYCSRNGARMDNNPSAGNKAGGLTTVLEKSLGGIAKAGSSTLVEVYEYAQPVRARGLVFMDTPGYDPISATGQVAGGANLICFTTGRGSAYGCAPSPSVKLATNTALMRRQSDDMDLNCGEVLDGTKTIQALGAELFQLMLDTASGRRSRSELHGYGQNEFVPWQISVIT